MMNMYFKCLHKLRKVDSREYIGISTFSFKVRDFILHPINSKSK